MRKLTFALLFSLVSTLCYGQSAGELNQKSKDLLSKGDMKNAVPLLKRAAELGNAEAEYNLGYCYQKGFEVPQNDSIANIWLLKSAKQGWKDSQFKIAYSYAIGRGVSKDDKQAFYWALQCAKQNDPDCMFNVIGCYKDGIGTKKNIDSMLVWATRLATLSNPEDLQLSGQITSARLNLAMIYRDGGDVTKNLLKSYTWFLIYNESKRDFSILVQQQNIEIVENIEKQLTSIDKEKAKNEAKRLLNHPLTNLANLHKQDL